MKRKVCLGLMLCLCLSSGLVLTSCGTDTAGGSSGTADESSSAEAEAAESGDSTEEAADTEDAETSAESEESEADWQVLALEDGTEISVLELAEGTSAIYGYYTCENDGSAWAFGGDTVGVAYLDESDDLNVYVYSIDFYQTEEDEDGRYYLCVLLNNVQEGTSTCWYVMNVLDDDGNTTGMVLQNPGNEEEYIYLTIDSTETTTEDETAEDSAAE